jgi:Calx-beta domain/Pectate lyase
MRRGLVLLLLAAARPAAAYEGFGAVTNGAGSCPTAPSTYTVTSLANSGAGTLRDAVSQNCRNIVFSVGGTITLTSDLLIQRSYLTIDGASAPSPGITVSAPGLRLALEASGSLGPITDVIVHHLRLRGDGVPEEGSDLLELDGQANPVRRIVIDHNTFVGSGDGNVDVWAEVSDVTVSWNVFSDAIQGNHFSNETPPNRERISFHHNVYARLNERQTRMRYDNLQVDFVNNVVYGWAWYEGGGRGLMLPSDPGYHPTLNVEDNNYHFVAGLPGAGSGDDAIEIDSATFPGSVYFNGNVVPAAENDAVSTGPRTPLPPTAEVTHFAAASLGDTVVPCVGTRLPLAGETQLLQQIASAIGGTGASCGGPAQPALAIGDAVVAEGDAGTTQAVFAVTVTPAATANVTVAWATANGTAVSPSDYAAGSGVVTIAPGGAGAVAVAVNGDTAVELPEAFTVNLSGATGATIADGQGAGTIANDDPVLELEPGAVVEHDLAAVGAAPDVELFRIRQQARSSYEIVLDATSGDLTPGVRLDRTASDTTTVVQSSVPVSTVGAARSLRWQNAASIAQDGEFVRVGSGACGSQCGPDDRFRLRVYETTYAVPRFNNGSSQGTVLILQNVTTDAVAGTVWFWNGAGALLGSSAFDLASRRSLALNTASVPGVAGQGGSITVSNTGRYGALAGKAVAIEPATGFTFDTPLEPRRR